jgi:hypothetical protein
VFAADEKEAFRLLLSSTLTALQQRQPSAEA